MDRLERILIVGGGLPGWMAAAFLQRTLGAAGCTVTLVESLKLETAGVGEGSDPALVRFLRDLHLEESAFMRECSATYKLGTRFSGWLRPDHHYWHPYGLCGIINQLDLFHFWLKCALADAGARPYSAYSLQALLAERRQAPRPVRGPSPIIETGGYSFHFDAATLADHLREIAVEAGVTHLFDDVRQAVPDGTGGISRVDTRSGRALSADLFLDCTTRGDLIELALHDAWQDWSARFLCDRTVTMPLPRDPEARPYTQASAAPAGWMWQTPLSHRVGCGYAYSSAHCSDDAAARDLVAQASASDGRPGRAAAAGELRHGQIRRGRRQTFWQKNCVALGPAAAAFEPLEATDVLVIQRGLTWLVHYFPDRVFNPKLGAGYNQRMTALCDTIRDFLLLHYYLNQRDEPFWRDARQAALTPGLETLAAMHDESGIVEPEQCIAFAEPSYHHVFAGHERLPRRPLAATDAVDLHQINEILAKIQNQNEEWLARLPSHRELMELLHRPTV